MDDGSEASSLYVGFEPIRIYVVDGGGRCLEMEKVANFASYGDPVFGSRLVFDWADADSESEAFQLLGGLADGASIQFEIRVPKREPRRLNMAFGALQCHCDSPALPTRHTLTVFDRK